MIINALKDNHNYGNQNGAKKRLGQKITKCEKIFYSLIGVACVSLGGAVVKLPNIKPGLRSAVTHSQHLHIFTFETDGEDEVVKATAEAKSSGTKLTPEFRLSHTISILQQSHPALPIRFKTLGTGTAWRDYCQKWTEVRNELSKLDPDSVVVVADNRDSFINLDLRSTSTSPIQRFITQIRSINSDGGSRVLIGAEPEPNLGGLTYSKPWDFYNPNSGDRLKKTCDSAGAGCQWRYMGDHTVNNGDLHIKGDGNNFIHPWFSFMKAYANLLGRRYLDAASDYEAPMPSLISPNMGLVAGIASNMANFLDRLQCLPHEDDQVLVSGYYFTFPNDIQLDFHAEALGNSYYKYSCKFKFKDPSKPQLRYGLSDSSPLFGHVPAMSKHSVQPQCLYDSLKKLSYPVESYQDRPIYFNPEGIADPDMYF